MPFASIGKFLPRASDPKLVGHARTALALEAGTAFIAVKNPALISRTRLVSIKAGLIHAIATSAPAKEELLRLKEPLFLAMKSAANIPLNDLRVEVRGTLVEDALS